MLTMLTKLAAKRKVPHSLFSIKMSRNMNDNNEGLKEELNKKIREQKVLLDELSNLKKGRRVYTQQRNSNIFFLADKGQTLSSCKKELDIMKKDLQDI